MGAALSVLADAFPPKPKWSVDQIPDMTGKVVIVTGGNAGIGFETIKALLQHNAKVYMATRSETKATAAIKELKTLTGKTAHFLKLDLSSMASIRQAAAEYQSKETQLHALWNNAGISQPPKDQLTQEGYDLSFGVMVIGHHVFTKELLPVLLSTAKQSGEKVRVISLSSSFHHVGPVLDYEGYRAGPARDRLGPPDLYCQSKTAIVLWARELGKLYSDQIVSISLNPGNIGTDILHDAPAVQRFIIRTFFAYPVPLGALTQLWAGTAPEAGDLNGKYVIPWARGPGTIAAQLTPEAGLKLWEWLELQDKQYADRR
ncbi:NAD(P)-binding protein [Ramaria rubella]|nr:NAD(P)-binding protein [Ramaria rubella]